MNIVMVVSDTFRWDYIGAYGNDWIKTPVLDKLAEESVLFEDAFAEGLPTIPARRVIYTGRNIVPFQYHPQKCDMVQLHGWNPLFDEDVTMAEHLRECDYVSALFNDVYHLMKPGKNFQRGFDCWRWIRGQEDDPFALRDRDRLDDLLTRAMWDRDVKERAWIIQHLMNRKDWTAPADAFVARTMAQAAEWLRDYSLDNPFYLHVECFDPHEPWDPPFEYARLYDPNFDSFDGFLPPGHASQMTDEQLANTKTAYAGECSMVDEWLGHLLDAIRETGHWDDTLIVFTSDHGCMMGEQGDVHKGANRLRNQVWQVPLLIRHPEGKGAGVRVKGFVQHQDIMPTVLKLTGQPVPDRCLGRDLWPQVEGRETGPDYVVTAFGSFGAIRNDKWCLIRPWIDMRGPWAPRLDLYDLQADPQELTNVADGNAAAVAEMSALMEAHLKKMAPLTQGHFQLAHSGAADFTFDSLPPFDK